MNKIIYVLIISFAFFFASCDDYLDIQDKGVMQEDKMFNDPQGFREAMLGVYASLNDNNLYGENLSFGMIDQLAQLYVNTRWESKRNFLNTIRSYNYNDPNVRGKIDAIWSQAYNVLAALNNFIKHIESTEIVTNFPDKEIIKAEAYALRAFLHFDIVRLFAPDYKLDPEAKGIPYSYNFSKEKIKRCSVKKVYENILSDLKVAENLMNEDYEAGINARYYKHPVIHVNKCALWALKARVYHTMGEDENAYKYAFKVVDSKKYNLVRGSAIADLNKGYLADSECIWGLYSDKVYDTAEKRFFSQFVQPNTNFVRSDYKELFEVKSFSAFSTDYRYEGYFEERNPGPYFIKLGNLSDEPDKKRIKGINIIRLPEMYYIMAKASYDENKTTALGYLNEVRRARGLMDLTEAEVSTKEIFTNAVLSEIMKEYWGEGQLFFEYKRLNKDISDYENTVYKASDEIYVLPMPEAEIEFGHN